MNPIIQTLFLNWSETRKDTPEYDRFSDTICEPNEAITPEQADTNYDLLSECVQAESEQAFTAGFQMAVQLLMGGVQS